MNSVDTELLNTKEEKWQKLLELCSTCNKCDLHRFRNKIVFGKGSHDAKILFVGEAPGEFEDKEGMPFVGRSGKLLDNLMGTVGLSLDNVYISNILKCRPPQNRDPQEAEQNCCIDYLRTQTKLLAPKIIVCLGRIAAMRIIKPNFKITIEHGKWFLKNGVFMTAVYHPSALLRDPDKKPAALIDFRSVRERAEELHLLD